MEGFPALEWLLLHTAHHWCTNVTLSLLLLNVSNCILTDRFAVERILPKSVLNSAPKDLHSKDNPDAHVVEFNGLGKFNGQSLRVRQNYFSFKFIAKKAVFEEKWLLDETHGVSPSQKLHLLNTVLHLSPKSGGLTSKCNGIEISVNDSATLCGGKGKQQCR